MIDKIHITNFRSLRDVEVNPQKVNLLIGPNNSGKSNFLKAIKFWGKPYRSEGLIFRGNENLETKVDCLIKNEEIYAILDIAHINTYGRFKKISNIDVTNVVIPLYSINISQIKKEAEVHPNIYTINDDCSNLVSFLDNMRDERKDIINKIEADLKRCVKDFDSISFRKTQNGEKYTFKKIGLTTDQGETFWAEELSDGTLYFLALLCIVHQPNPPAYLLLEEPENGIHPRRIKEMMDYIFELAEDKNIQVFITTHNTYVIDQFKDIPESVFVFDKIGAETVVKNLQDIINEDKIQAEKDGLPAMDLSGSLGDHWASGLIGGIPI
jgi:predicted ATPase